MPLPRPTPIYRLMHLDNLSVCLERGGMDAPNHTPNDGRIYRTIHDIEIQQAQLDFVFSDGHGIAAFTQWFDNVTELNQIDWDVVYADYWADTIADMDRQRRK